MPTTYDLSTVLGKQILKEYLLCFRPGGWPPIPPYGITKHYTSCKDYELKGTKQTFSNHCKKIAAVAHKQMPQEDFDKLLAHVKDHFKNSKKYPPERVRKELIKNRTGVAPANANDGDNNPNPPASASVNHSPDNRSMSNILQLSDDDDSYDSDDLDEVSEGDMALPSDMYSCKDDYSSVDPLLHAEVDGQIIKSTKKVTKMPPAVPKLIAPQVDELTMKSIPSVSKRPAEVFALCGTEVYNIEDGYEGLLSSSF